MNNGLKNGIIGICAVIASISIIGCSNSTGIQAGVQNNEEIGQIKKTYKYNGNSYDVYFRDSGIPNDVVNSDASEKVMSIYNTPGSGFAVDPVDSTIVWLYTNDAEWKAVIDSIGQNMPKPSLRKTTEGSLPRLCADLNYTGHYVIVQSGSAWDLSNCVIDGGGNTANFDNQTTSIKIFTDGYPSIGVKVFEHRWYGSEGCGTNHNATIYKSIPDLRKLWIIWPFQNWNDFISSAETFLIY